jgi:hypothetical protein
MERLPGKDGVSQQTVTFLSDYVVKHFGDEERLQVQSSYPDTLPIRSSTTGTAVTADVMQELLQAGPTVKAMGDLNRVVSVLISHIAGGQTSGSAHAEEIKRVENLQKSHKSPGAQAPGDVFCKDRGKTPAEARRASF